MVDFGLAASALTGKADFTRDLGLDSLDTTDLLIRVEAAYDVRIAERDWHSLRTIDDVTVYLLNEHGIRSQTACAVPCNSGCSCGRFDNGRSKPIRITLPTPFADESEPDSNTDPIQP